MKNILKILSIVLIVIAGFLFITCKEEEQINLDDLTFGGEYYLSDKAPQTPQSFNDITAAELVAGMVFGWNLGNSFDAHPNGETSWGNPRTTQANMTALKNASINTIRIPVTWYQAANKDHTIRTGWMDRVTEVVNYAVNEDMYIILNTHHDEELFKFTSKEKEKSLNAFYMIWSQIAYNFKNYNEKLIFEALNEPRTKGPNEWSGGTPAEREILNEYYQLFVEVVRASGGNNDKRIIMVNTYAASAEQSAMNGLKIPTDTVENKIIVSIHAYSPYNFALNQGNGATDKWSKNNPSDTSGVRTVFDRAYNTFVSKGYPVVMGEFGAVDRQNQAARDEWAEYYVGYARSKGIPCVLWDNGGFSGAGELFGFFRRNNNTFAFPSMLAAFLRGAEGNN